jgi:hypothetical protein
MAPRLAVIVPATDSPAPLSACRAALEAARAPTDELVVVDRAPGAGAGAARNHGVAGTDAEIVVFVDSDVVVHPDALESIRSRFAADPGLVALFGCYDDDPAERDVVSTFRNLLHHHVHREAVGPVDSFWSGLGAVRRSAFDAVGGFREIRAVEDIELGARLGTLGRIELDDAIQGKHLKRWTLRSMVHTDFFLRGVPWAEMALDGSATRRGLNLGWRHRLSAATAVVATARLLRGRPASAGAALAALGALNAGFYRLLAARGPRYLLAGVPLHVIHHLTSVAALVVVVLRKPGRLAALVRAR